MTDRTFTPTPEPPAAPIKLSEPCPACLGEGRRSALEERGSCDVCRGRRTVPGHLARDWSAWRTLSERWQKQRAHAEACRFRVLYYHATPIQRAGWRYMAERLERRAERTRAQAEALRSGYVGARWRLAA